MFKRTRIVPQARKAAPMPTQAVIVAAPPQEKRPMSLNQLGEKDTQPLFHRLVLAAGTVVAGRARIHIFNKAKNVNPELTNLEVAGAMPNTSRFTLAGIEIRVNPNTTSAALAMFLKATRMTLSVGAKNYEKLNQPSVMFPGLSAVKGVAGLDFTAVHAKGLYIFNPGEEVILQESQTFDAGFEVDPTGFILGAGDLLDIVIVYKGQKQAVVAL
ncbi:MAG: hypothetical protein Q8K67_11280 [Geothrix sp.]|nr:hypothetical protein [Geothrix sp.]